MTEEKLQKCPECGFWHELGIVCPGPTLEQLMEILRGRTDRQERRD